MAAVYEYMMENPMFDPYEVIGQLYGISMMGWPLWPEWALKLCKTGTSKCSSHRLRFLDIIFRELEINGYLKIDGDKRK